MKAACYFFFLSLALLGGDDLEVGKRLMSDDFSERQEAEKELVEWTQEKDSKVRAEQLFQRYLISEDPEEFHRLAKILIEVHFEHKKAEIPQTGSGFIGISMARAQRQFQQGLLQQVPEPKRGVLIESVIEGTPAEKAGLQAGDMVVAIEGESIACDSPSDRLKEIVGAEPPGTKILLTVERGEENLEIEVTLMNAKAVPPLRVFGDQPRVDVEKAEQLLKDDYLRWLVEKRAENRNP